MVPPGRGPVPTTRPTAPTAPSERHPTSPSTAQAPPPSLSPGPHTRGTDRWDPARWEPDQNGVGGSGWSTPPQHTTAEPPGTPGRGGVSSPLELVAPRASRVREGSAVRAGRGAGSRERPGATESGLTDGRGCWLPRTDGNGWGSPAADAGRWERMLTDAGRWAPMPVAGGAAGASSVERGRVLRDRVTSCACVSLLRVRGVGCQCGGAAAGMAVSSVAAGHARGREGPRQSVHVSRGRGARGLAWKALGLVVGRGGLTDSLRE